MRLEKQPRACADHARRFAVSDRYLVAGYTAGS
jgi:hypothetical protein